MVSRAMFRIPKVCVIKYTGVNDGPDTKGVCYVLITMVVMAQIPKYVCRWHNPDRVRVRVSQIPRAFVVGMIQIER